MNYPALLAQGSSRDLFLQTVKLAQKAGLVKMGHVAVDGTKIKANASKHSAMSYKHMIKEEKRLRKEIKRFFKEADEIDEKENKKYGNKRGDELPEHLATQERRLKAITEAKRALEEDALKKAEENNSKKNKDGGVKKVKPKPKAQRNFTDPESRIMLNSDKAFIQAYNAQVAVDSDSQIIVAADLTNQPLIVLN